MAERKKKNEAEISTRAFPLESPSNRPFPSLLKASLSKRGLVHNHSYENEFNLHVNEISFSYERMSTKSRFEKEAKGNSEMAYQASLNKYKDSRLQG